MAKSVIDSEENKRFGGSFNLPGNFEVKKEGPLDTRMVVGSITELLGPTTINDENKYQYYGMLVVVSGDDIPENDGLYRLLENGNPNETSGWEKIGTSNSDDLLSNSDFNAHTGDTTNPHKTSFSNLISTAHTHTITDITDLQSELNNKLNTSDFNNYSGSVATQISGKLDTTTFVSYTGSVKDVHVSSGTVNAQTQSVTFTNTTGGTFDLSNAPALFTDSDSYVTGGTYNANTGIVSYINSTGGTFDVTGFTEGITDTFVDSGTLDGTTLKLTKSDSSTVSDIELSGLQIWDKNNSSAYYNTGNVGIGTSSPSQKLDVNGVTKSDVFAVRNGVNTRIISPEGAEYEDVNDKLGRIKITAPATIDSSSQATQFKSTIKVFYSGGLFDLHISCYIQNNGSDTKPMTWQYAYIDSPPDRNNKYNFKVNLYFDENNKFAISIGEHDSSWGFLKVVVTDVILGFNNDSIDDWSTGWSIELDTNETISTNTVTPIKTISATQANNWEKVGNSLKYSVGDVNISNGRLIINDYVLPTSKGDNGDIIQINSSGNLDWVDASSLQTQSIWTESGSDIYYNQGNVGIGTDTPLNTLHVESSGVTAIRVKSTDNANAGFHVIDKDDNAITLGIRNEKLKLNRSGSLANENHLVIDSSGNVGINTDSPSQKLEVAGNIKVSGTYANVTTDLSTTGVNTFALSGVSSQLSELKVTSTNSEFLSFGTRGSTEASFPTYGKNGDNYIYSSTNANGLNIISSPGTTTDDYIKFYAGQYASGSADVSIIGSGTTRGYVGIGTETPSQKLEVDGNIFINDTSSSLTINDYTFPTSKGDNGQIIQINSSGNLEWIDASSLQTQSIWSEKTSNAYYSTGNVGIGTDSPTQELEVAGVTKSDAFALYNTHHTRIISPEGAELAIGDTTLGRIRITAPPSRASQTQTQFRATIKVFDDSHSFDIHVSCYIYNNQNIFWANAWIDSPPDDTNKYNFKVTLYYDQDNKFNISIGEHDSSWRYAKVVVTDVILGANHRNIDNWSTGWSITLDSDTQINKLDGGPEVTIQATQANNWRKAGNSLKYDGGNVNISNGTLTINNNYTLPSTDGNTGQVLKTDGSGNVTWQNDTDTNTSIWTEDTTTNTATYGGNIIADSISSVASNNVRILNPAGAEYSSGDKEGYIVITLPQGWTNTMLSMSVKIFDYTQHEHATINLAGYTYMGGTGNPYWANCSSWVEGNPKDEHNFTIRFGYDNAKDKCVIVIGNIDTLWKTPKVYVTDLQVATESYSASNWNSGWDIEINNTVSIDSNINSTSGIWVTKTFYSTQAHNWVRNTDNSIIYNQGTVNIGLRSVSENNIKLFATRDGSNETGNKDAIPTTGIGDSTHTALGYGTSTTNSYGIAMGTLASSGRSWIQSKRFKGDGTQEYKLLLNPLGGEVGIGTSLPTEQLEVAGNIFINDTSSSLKINDYTLPASDGNTGQVLKTNGSGVVTWQDDTDTNSSIWAENTSYTRDIDSTNVSGAYYTTGFVGIGTNEPQSKLHLEGSSFDSSAIRFLNTVGPSYFPNTDYWMIGSRSSSSGDDGFEIGRNSEPAGGKLYITNTGNVSIGNGYQPTNKLEVAGSALISKPNSASDILTVESKYSNLAYGGADGVGGSTNNLILKHKNTTFNGTTSSTIGLKSANDESSISLTTYYTTNGANINYNTLLMNSGGNKVNIISADNDAEDAILSIQADESIFFQRGINDPATWPNEDSEKTMTIDLTNDKVVIDGGFTLNNGTQGVGKVLTSDSNGTGVWDNYGLTPIYKLHISSVELFKVSSNTFNKIKTSDSFTGYVEVELPDISVNNEKNEVVIKHIGGIQTIHINPPSGTLIDNYYGDNIVIVSNGDSMTFYCDGYNWYIKSHYSNIFTDMPGHTMNTYEAPDTPEIRIQDMDTNQFVTEVNLAHHKQIRVHTSDSTDYTTPEGNKANPGNNWSAMVLSGDFIIQSSGFDGEIVSITVDGDDALSGEIQFSSNGSPHTTLNVNVTK